MIVDDVIGRARDLAALALANPFSPERIELEKRVLGAQFVAGARVWSLHAAAPTAPSVNAERASELAWSLACELRERLRRGARMSGEERAIYRTVAFYALYGSAEAAATSMLQLDGEPLRTVGWRAFREKGTHLLASVGAGEDAELPHLFATVFQIRRAFHHVFTLVVGDAPATGRLREAIWQSIFTHDLRRYIDGLHARMRELSTLVLGPSGTGKELVARSIAWSSYVPFDAAAERFAVAPIEQLLAVNVTALSPTLIESELFGHRRGAFTGAVADRTGWLDSCSPQGTVFLDEIGDLDLALQAKLLRVLQARRFTPIGDTQERRFEGKVVAATHRDLGADPSRFRPDLYYRLCADVVRTPSLAERIAEAPGELDDLVLFLSRRIAGPEAAAPLAEEVLAFIRRHLPHHPWPGNVRELEQCVRNVMVRRRYDPAPIPTEEPGLLAGLLAGEPTLEELSRRYVREVVARVGSYRAAARVLDIDRRTVARYVGDAD
ncbi:MAG: sigma 54-interacting transcriptional regulator [Polyangiaceae bacterium]